MGKPVHSNSRLTFTRRTVDTQEDWTVYKTGVVHLCSSRHNQVTQEPIFYHVNTWGIIGISAVTSLYVLGQSDLRTGAETLKGQQEQGASPNC